MATTQDLINYYADLLILQYKGQPKAYATIQAIVAGPIADQLPIAVQDAFDLDTAVGVQLDVLGKYAGVVRTGYAAGQPITLVDIDFRTLIKIAIIQNSAGSSLADIQNLIFQYFPGTMQVIDYKNMRMSYLISSSIGSQDLVQMFLAQGLLPAPMAVAIATVIYAPIINTFFGFRTYQLPAVNASPFNTYTDYQTNRPWLSYQNAIII